MNILKAFGHECRTLFTGGKAIGKEIGPIAVKIGDVVVEAQPIADVVLDAALPWASPLYNAAVLYIKAAEKLATSHTTNEQKAAQVLLSLQPLASSLLTQHGVVTPSDDQINRYLTGAIITLSAFDAVETPATAGQ